MRASVLFFCSASDIASGRFSFVKILVLRVLLSKFGVSLLRSI